MKNTLDGVVKDQALYQKKLKFAKDGTKLNPVSLTGYDLADSEALGKKIIEFYRGWKLKRDEPDEKQIGTLYGFKLYIRQQKEGYEEDNLFKYRLQNHLFAEGPGEIKYLSGGGHPNVDNRKLAARYFLNAIDKVNGLRDTCEKKRSELETEIPTLRELNRKTFEKEGELTELRVELRRLEREIAAKIRETQMKALPVEEEEAAAEETINDTLDHSENLRNIRLQSFDRPDYPANGFGGNIISLAHQRWRPF